MGKRANGEGTVYQRKDGRWVASINLEDGTRKSIYCKTQKDAIKAARQINEEKDMGLLITTKDQTLGQFLTSWLQDTAQPRLRERTYIRYRGLIEHHILPTLGKITLQKLSPQHLQRLYNTKLKEGYAPQSVKHIHRLLHKALNDALRWRLVTHNVCDAVDPPRVPKHEMQVFTYEQSRVFLDAVKGDPLEALYVLALTSGMRQGELLGLKWDDIQFMQGTLQVRRTVAHIGGQGFRVMEPKTAKSRRSIHLTEMALDALKQHRVQQHELRLQTGPLWDDQNWVFCNSIGRPIDARNLLRRSFRPLLERAGLPPIRFHDLRHSAATLLLSIGVHAKIVQELLGHSNITLTMDTYSHVLPSLQANAIQQLNKLFMG